MTQPKVSVVITTHDKYTDYLINRCLPSVFAQTFQDIEIIVVKDGGDDIGPRLDAFLDQRLRYVHIKKAFKSHPGPKNVGTLEAEADFVCYLDADNAYRPDHIQALWKAMQKTPCDMVYGDRMCIFDDGKQKVGVKSDFSLALLGQQNYIDTSDGLIRKQAILDVGGWDESLAFFADWNLWVRMAKNGSIFRHVPLVITDYYIHGANNVMKAAQLTPAEYEKWHFANIQNCTLWPEKTTIGERPPMKVAVFMLTMNRLEYTIETITTMYEKASHPFDLYILDQGSDDKTAIWLADHEEKFGFKYKLLGENVGISKGSNLALDWIAENGPYDVIGKVDNDCFFLTDDWLKTMVECYERSRGVILAPYPEGLIDHPGGWPRVRDGYIHTHYVGVTEHVGGLCVFAPAKCYKSFRWDEDDFLHGQQDWIFSQEMRKRGFVPIYLENVRVSHGGGTDAQKQRYPDYFAKRETVERRTRYEKPERA